MLRACGHSVAGRPASGIAAEKRRRGEGRASRDGDDGLALAAQEAQRCPVCDSDDALSLSLPPSLSLSLIYPLGAGPPRAKQLCVSVGFGRERESSLGFGEISRTQV